MLTLENAKWAGIPAYNLATVFTKASVLMFYLRFTVDMHFIFCAYAVLLIVVANCIFHTIAAIACRCPAYEGGNCQAIVNMYAASAVINCVSDLILLVLPFWLLHPMKVPLTRKIGITIILMAGGFVLIVSIIRLVTTVKVDEDLDFTYSLGYGLLCRLIITFPHPATRSTIPISIFKDLANISVVTYTNNYSQVFHHKGVDVSLNEHAAARVQEYRVATVNACKLDPDVGSVQYGTVQGNHWAIVFSEEK
ncbi:hypothetical protein FAGAP_11050 [Fusarium agapanthi]|uniref:Rhodopsin domain-containing protein n=1 Tax=Fusarium agapanthi TaxID=1803897 RepID=A0A9P5EA05_9HYPO|nr:hypothetical protein FAGAP_11050 [Fusarium agapanthi]